MESARKKEGAARDAGRERGMGGARVGRTTPMTATWRSRHPSPVVRRTAIISGVLTKMAPALGACHPWLGGNDDQRRGGPRARRGGSTGP